MFAKALSLFFTAAVLPAALAKIYITQPVASTVWPVGKPVTMTWEDDGSAPSLSTIGVCSLGIYAGNQLQQTLLQQIGTLDVSKNNSISLEVNGDIGPNNEAVYFMRFTSLGLMDPSNPQYPEQAFSAMFAITGSTSTGFNATVQSEINGASTAGAIGATAPPAAATASKVSSVVVVVATPTPSASAAKSSTTAQAASANAGNVDAPRLSAAGVFVAGLAFAAFFL